VKARNEQIRSAGLPIQQLDLAEPIGPQLDVEVWRLHEAGYLFRRMDASQAIVERLSKELRLMTPAERIRTNSMSTDPMVWQWRGIPIRCKNSLPDSCVAFILESPETRTFRGEIPGFVPSEE
jgi:hypothetical protein